jgi:hypothetical protein
MRMGDVDVLANNVGGGGRWGQEDILETGAEVWSEVYQKMQGSLSSLQSSHYLGCWQMSGAEWSV